MSLILNGTTATDVYLNGVKCTQAYLNGTSVFTANIIPTLGTGAFFMNSASSYTNSYPTSVTASNNARGVTNLTATVRSGSTSWALPINTSIRVHVEFDISRTGEHAGAQNSDSIQISAGYKSSFTNASLSLAGVSKTVTTITSTTSTTSTYAYNEQFVGSSYIGGKLILEFDTFITDAAYGGTDIRIIAAGYYDSSLTFTNFNFYYKLL